MSQLGLGLGLTKGGVVPFNPLSLNPYLLFDTQSSMIGTFENPTLDLDPSKPDTLNVITATRAGVATYTDADGNIATAPADMVRVDYVDGVPMILVEPSATNLVTYSEDFSDSYWTKSGSSSVTPNTTISPDGTLNADTISNATGTSTGDTVYRTINPDDVDHTFSAYVKSAGATTMSLIARNGISGVIRSQAISLTDEWQRVTLTHNIQNGQIIFGNSDGDFHLWGAQFEQGSVATSYIPTSGSTVTRAADDLVIDGSDFTDFYNPAEGTFYVEIQPKNIQENIGFVSGQNSDSIFLYSNLNSLYVANYDGANYLGLTPVDSSQLNRMATTYSASEKRISLNGSETSGAYNGNFATANMIYIGSGYWGSSYILGHIKRLIYWPYSSDRL